MVLVFIPTASNVAAVVTFQQSGEMTAYLWGIFDGRLARHRDDTRTLLQQGKLSVTAATSSRFALT